MKVTASTKRRQLASYQPYVTRWTAVRASACCGCNGVVTGGADTREIHRHEPAQENCVGTRLVSVDVQLTYDVEKTVTS